jgi:hypothetical protein
MTFRAIRFGIPASEPESTSDLDLAIDPAHFVPVIEAHTEDVRAIGLATFVGIREALTKSGSHLKDPFGKIDVLGDFEKDLLEHLKLLPNFPIRTFDQLRDILYSDEYFENRPLIHISNGITTDAIIIVYAGKQSLAFTGLLACFFAYTVKWRDVSNDSIIFCCLVAFALWNLLCLIFRQTILNFLDYNSEIVPGLKLYEVGNIEKLCAVGMHNPELVDLITYVKLRIETLETSIEDIQKDIQNKMQENIDYFLSYDMVCTYTAEEYAEINDRITSNPDVLNIRQAEIEKLKLELARLVAIKKRIGILEVESEKISISNKQSTFDKEEKLAVINTEIARLQSMLHPTRVVDYSHLDRLNRQMNPTSVQIDFMTNVPVQPVTEEQNVQLNSVVAATSAK